MEIKYDESLDENLNEKSLPEKYLGMHTKMYFKDLYKIFKKYSQNDYLPCGKYNVTIELEYKEMDSECIVRPMPWMTFTFSIVPKGGKEYTKITNLNHKNTLRICDILYFKNEKEMDLLYNEGKIR